MYRVIQEYVAIHELGRKGKYLFNVRGWAGPAPCPLPPAPLAEPWGGGGGGWQAMSCLGNLERGRGDLWLVILAGHIRVWIWRVSTARHFGGSARRVSLAGQVGSFIQ